MFIGGCGRFFEGSPSQMHHSLYEKLGTLPDNTLVWVGHEYTLANYKFAVTVEPDNQELAAAVALAKDQRANGTPTIPSTIGREKASNVFMRCGEGAIAAACGCTGKPVIDVLGKLRKKKDNF